MWVLWAAGCGEEAPSGPRVAGGYYLGAEACRQCHSTAYNAEIKTAHFNTFVDDPNDPGDFVSVWKEQGQPTECLPCHTTGWNEEVDNHGADEVAYRKERLGIQCEQCHGPGSEHVAGGGDPTKINVDYSSELCGSCHTGEHHPTYEEWETSAHKEALEDLQGLPFAEDECLECHSADYWYDRTVTLETAKYGITCVMCHFAHGSNFEYQLREEGEKLCALCHTDERAQPGETPHHPQDEMLAGFGGYEWEEGGPYTNSPHTYLIDERCVKCHMYTRSFAPNRPAITGHSWKPNIAVCQECHPGTTNFNIGGARTHIQNLLDQLYAELEQQQNENDPIYLRAKFDYEFVNNDKSLGVHNYNYAEKLLEDSIEFYTPSNKGYVHARPPVARR